jgi:hypothetical protein
VARQLGEALLTAIILIPIGILVFVLICAADVQQGRFRAECAEWRVEKAVTRPASASARRRVSGKGEKLTEAAPIAMRTFRSLQFALELQRRDAGKFAAGAAPNGDGLSVDEFMTLLPDVLHHGVQEAIGNTTKAPWCDVGRARVRLTMIDDAEFSTVCVAVTMRLPQAEMIALGSPIA